MSYIVHGDFSWELVVPVLREEVVEEHPTVGRLWEDIWNHIGK